MVSRHEVRANPSLSRDTDKPNSVLHAHEGRYQALTEGFRAGNIAGWSRRRVEVWTRNRLYKNQRQSVLVHDTRPTDTVLLSIQHTPVSPIVLAASNSRSIRARMTESDFGEGGEPPMKRLDSVEVVEQLNTSTQSRMSRIAAR